MDPADRRRMGCVVITRNGRGRLPQTLERLRGSSELAAVVVVDNDSTDGTPELVESRFPDVDLVRLGRNAGASGRNVGVERLDTRYVAFSDDDSWWEPGSLERAADILDSNPQLALVAARIVLADGREDPTTAAMADSPLGDAGRSPGRAVLGFVACGSVVRRSAFLRAGGFNPHYGVGGEERLLATDMRMNGNELAYVPEVVARHDPVPGPRAGRAAVMVRNDLWSSWLRRAPATVARTTIVAAARALRDPDMRAGLLAAVKGVRWVAAERRPVPPQLERELRLID
jgi:GT2 family glycosyltransferase